MPPPQIISFGSLTPVRGRMAGGMDSEYGPEPRRKRALQDGAPRVLAGPDPAVDRATRPQAAASRGTRSVLSAREFQLFLERERSLADRGTRRFSLLVLRRRGARAGRRGRDAVAEFARQALERLRSTDLVGRLDADRVEILLTDTEPAGAQVVAAWLEQVEAKLGLDLGQTIYVYPSVAEPRADGKQDEGPHENGPEDGMRSNGHGNGRPMMRRESAVNAHVASVAEDWVATNGRAVDGHINGQNGHNGHNGHSLRPRLETSVQRTQEVVPFARWPIEDLWPRFGVPTPVWKRSLDILFSALALLLLLPLFALIAIAIRLDSTGPVIFRQLRAGRGARPFVFYKFRSMIADAEEARAALAGLNEQDGPIFKIREDPRITRVGRWLRRWSMDELPQLWNVLKGDICVVGPRSPTFDEVHKYERWQRRRLCVSGGITCIWQVSGRSQIPFREWMRLDMRYVACRNLWLDLRLLALTLPAVLSGRGAC